MSDTKDSFAVLPPGDCMQPMANLELDTWVFELAQIDGIRALLATSVLHATSQDSVRLFPFVAHLGRGSLCCVAVQEEKQKRNLVT